MNDSTLIVGAAGFIGRAITARLCSLGNTVIAGIRSPVNDLPDTVRTQLVPYDDPTKLRNLLQQCETIVYVASDSTPLSTAHDPVSELDINLRPLLTLLEQLTNNSLIYLSSAGSLYSSNSGHLIHEHELPAPRSYHGAAKAAAEHFIGAWVRQNEAGATIIRPSNVFGPGQHPKKGFGIIPTAFRAALQKESISIRGDGRAARDYLYIDDLVDLCVAAIHNRQSAGIEVLNAGTGAPTPLNTLLDLIDDVTETHVERQYDLASAVDAASTAVNPSRARELLGWQPKTALREGLEHTWKWFRAQYQS